MIRVAIDTNALVSAVISPTRPNAQLFDLIIAKKIRPYLSDDVQEEYERVFRYERQQFLDKKADCQAT